MSSGLASLMDAKTILLTTYKRDGTPVQTPVSIAFDGDQAFFRSYDKAWKTKRLRGNPQVEAAPCTLLGKRTGPAVQARGPCSTANRQPAPVGPWRGATGYFRESLFRWLTASGTTRPCTTNSVPTPDRPRKEFTATPVDGSQPATKPTAHAAYGARRA